VWGRVCVCGCVVFVVRVVYVLEARNSMERSPDTYRLNGRGYVNNKAHVCRLKLFESVSNLPHNTVCSIRTIKKS